MVLFDFCRYVFEVLYTAINRLATVKDILSNLQRHHLIPSLERVKYALYFDHCQWRPLSPESTLDTIGIGDLSMLFLRFSRQGGASTPKGTLYLFQFQLLCNNGHATERDRKGRDSASACGESGCILKTVM